MTAIYNDPVPDGDFSWRHRYKFEKGYCTWCGKHMWLTEEKRSEEHTSELQSH